MKAKNGFSLMECILTMLLMGILANGVIELIVQPMQAYFWVSEEATQTNLGNQSIEFMHHELQEAMPTTLKYQSDGTGIQFRKSATSPPIDYFLGPNQRLIRKSENETNIIASSVHQCIFTPMGENKPGVIISLSLGKAPQTLSFIQPIPLEKI